jgi:hypothetical protein
MALPDQGGAKRRKRNKRVRARLNEDGSVNVTGPRGRTGVPNVGEGGKPRGGYGTVRQFGPTTGRAGIKRDPRKTRKKRGG